MINTNKISILVVVRWPVGGIRTFMRYVYRHFEPELYLLTILCPDFPEIDILYEDLKVLNVEIKKVSHHPSSYEFITAITKLVVSGKYDLVHSHGFTSGICAAVPVFLARRPHILTPHDILNDGQFTGLTGLIKKNAIAIALFMIPTIQCVSNDARNNLLSRP
jgi:hypothetical protein